MNSVQPEKGAWAIVALLFLFMMINFADKAIIGLAGVPIMTELELDAESNLALSARASSCCSRSPQSSQASSSTVYARSWSC